MTSEKWLAADLNCVVMREHISEVDRDHGKIEFLPRGRIGKAGRTAGGFF
jgi:hypothetical protein